MIQNEKKYTVEEIKNISPKKLLNIIESAKNDLKSDPVMKKVFKKHKVDIDFINYIPIKFGNIKVSATTSHGIITINNKLLLDGNFHKDYGYLVHEIVHYLQQCFGDRPTQGADEGDYLENPHEQEGFQYQIKYIADNYGKEEASDYVDDLLDHHDVEDKEDRRDKKDKLMNKV